MFLSEETEARREQGAEQPGNNNPYILSVLTRR